VEKKAASDERAGCLLLPFFALETKGKEGKKGGEKE